ncbi:MBL fold metallo-hydrolase [Desulfurispira natronophila]|uniref:Ribonuclease BN (tRNA processing enzyme) n=1 Tax=Desulfurispira natronophila TaxID=682562 RepID=A0A7W7Y678_9BACT|nr:ribonuclease Z [Desulfurispira natronophila]MBB5022804.1 ribonuclease BN (tRNA processing enzyme) [Desulfurispira natronophila]
MEYSPVSLTVLGSGSAVPFQQRASASYLLRCGNSCVLLDAGFWVMERLEQTGTTFDDIDAIFISHRHPDHCMGLIHLLFASRHPSCQRTRPLKIFGFNGLAGYLEEFRSLLGSWIEPPFALEVDESTSGSLGPFLWQNFAVHHSQDAVGIRIQCYEKRIVYTGDTGYHDDLIAHCREADLLIADCGASRHQPLDGHMHVDQILHLAQQAQVKHLLQSHFYPETEPLSQQKTRNFRFLCQEATDLLTIAF